MSWIQPNTPPSRWRVPAVGRRQDAQPRGSPAPPDRVVLLGFGRRARCWTPACAPLARQMKGFLWRRVCGKWVYWNTQLGTDEVFREWIPEDCSFYRKTLFLSQDKTLVLNSSWNLSSELSRLVLSFIPGLSSLPLRLRAASPAHPREQHRRASPCQALLHVLMAPDDKLPVSSPRCLSPRLSSPASPSARVDFEAQSGWIPAEPPSSTGPDPRDPPANGLD